MVFMSNAFPTCHACVRTAFDPERFNAQAAFHVAVSSEHEPADRITARQLLVDWIEAGNLAAEGWEASDIAEQLAFLARLYDELVDLVLGQVDELFGLALGETDEGEEEDDALTVVTVLAPVSDQGSVVVFKGVTDDGRELRFAFDHRFAQTLCDGLSIGDDVRVALEGWQVLG
jgi:hypothetical protein